MVNGLLKSYWFFHFGIIVTVNTLSFFHGSLAERWFSHLLSAPTLPLYLTISGNEAAYGFFAPQVGSQYLTQFTLYNETGHVLLRTSTPRLHTSAGVVRYSRLLDGFQALVNRPITEIHLPQRRARALAYNLAFRLGKSLPEVRCIRVQVYVCGEDAATLKFLYQKCISL